MPGIHYKSNQVFYFTQEIINPAITIQTLKTNILGKIRLISIAENHYFKNQRYLPYSKMETTREKAQ